MVDFDGLQVLSGKVRKKAFVVPKVIDFGMLEDVENEKTAQRANIAEFGIFWAVKMLYRGGKVGGFS